jgi:DNA-binding response OmpR family regulator
MTSKRALVVDADVASRRRLADLLRATGWTVAETGDAAYARRRAARFDPDLVVTDATVSGRPGADLLRRLRATGSTAHFLVVAADPTDAVRAEAADAGALATLAKPVDSRLLLDFLRSRATGPAGQGRPSAITEADDLEDDDLDADLAERLAEMYVSALPARLSAIAGEAREGNAPGLAGAATALAGTSGQLGHPAVAEVCRAIAADARRGVLAHARLVQLHDLAGS